MKRSFVLALVGVMMASGAALAQSSNGRGGGESGGGADIGGAMSSGGSDSHLRLIAPAANVQIPNRRPTRVARRGHSAENNCWEPERRGVAFSDNGVLHNACPTN